MHTPLQLEVSKSKGGLRNRGILDTGQAYTLCRVPGSQQRREETCSQHGLFQQVGFECTPGVCGPSGMEQVFTLGARHTLSTKGSRLACRYTYNRAAPCTMFIQVQCLYLNRHLPIRSCSRMLDMQRVPVVWCIPVPHDYLKSVVFCAPIPLTHGDLNVCFCETFLGRADASTHLQGFLTRG